MKFKDGKTISAYVRTIGERLQQVASPADGVTTSSPSGGTPPSHTWKETEWTLAEPTLQQDQPTPFLLLPLVCMTTPMVEELNQPLQIHHWSHTCHNSARLCYS